MSVEGIIDRIIDDADTRAKEIIEEAKGQARSIHQDGKREAEEYYEQQLARLNEKYRKEKERTVLNKRLAQRKSILQSRQVWMDRAFSSAYGKLVAQPFSEYRELVIALIMSVSGSKNEEVIFGQKGDEKDLKKIIDELNRKTGGKFALAKKRGEFPWGFILKKGKIETNLSIESLFKYKRNDLEQRAWELFNANA